MMVPILVVLLPFLSNRLQQSPLSNTPLREPFQSSVPISRLAPNGPSSLGVGVLSRSVSQEEVDGESPILLKHGETDGVSGDEGGSESLHSVVVDEAFGLDGLHGEVEGCRRVNLNTTEREERRGEM